MSNVPAGTYAVTVTDAMGCSIIRTAEVTQPTPFRATPQITNITCSQLTGAINTTIAGGTIVNTRVPYSYSWAAGAGGSIPQGQGNRNSLTGLTAGTYTLTVTDGNDCTASFTFTITRTATMTLTPTLTPTACADRSTGVCSLAVQNGTGPFTYAGSRSGNSTASPIVINNLAVGTYAVTVTDAASCTASATYTITSLPGLTINFVVMGSRCSTNNAVGRSMLPCPGGNNGLLTANVAGGAPQTNYTWNWLPANATLPNQPTSNTASSTIRNVADNTTYSVTVTDATTLCTSTVSTQIISPPAISTTTNTCISTP